MSGHREAVSRTPMSAAKRMRLYRQRQREGLWVVRGRVALPSDLADKLIAARFLPDTQEIMGADIVIALERLLDALGAHLFRNAVVTRGSGKEW